MMKMMITNSLDTVANGETVCTSNRRLQNFLFILGIKTTSFSRNWDGYTMWCYKVDDKLRLAVKDFATMETRRARMVGTASA